MKRILFLLVPEAPILIGVALLVTLPGLRPAANGLVDVYPYTVLAAALLLGFRFNRSRLVFTAALLAIAQYVLDAGLATPEQRLFFHATTFLLPLNLALVALLPERGTLTPRGLVRWVLIAVQVTIIAFLAKSFPTQATAVLRTRFLPSVLSDWTPLAQPALVAFLGMGAVLVLAWVREPQAPVRGYTYALIATFLGLTWKAVGPGQEIWIATAGLVLVVAVVEASYMMAYRDGLTELPGRRALNEALPRLSVSSPWRWSTSITSSGSTTRTVTTRGTTCCDSSQRGWRTPPGGPLPTATAEKSLRCSSTVRAPRSACHTSRSCVKRWRRAASRCGAASARGTSRPLRKAARRARRL